MRADKRIDKLEAAVAELQERLEKIHNDLNDKMKAVAAMFTSLECVDGDGLEVTYSNPN